MEPELCVEHGLGLHRQRLRYPKSLALKRNGGGGHIVHRAEDAYAECEQGGKKAVGKSEHFKYCYNVRTLYEQKCTGNNEYRRAEGAVEHICRA